MSKTVKQIYVTKEMYKKINDYHEKTDLSYYHIIDMALNDFFNQEKKVIDSDYLIDLRSNEATIQRPIRYSFYVDVEKTKTAKDLASQLGVKEVVIYLQALSNFFNVK